QQLSDYRARVHSEFRAVIASPDDEEEAQVDQLATWTGLWDKSVRDEEAEAFLTRQECDDAQRVLAQLKNARESRAVLRMQASSRNRLDAVMPRLLAALARGAAADDLSRGMAETLARIEPLVESIARRSAYLVLLVEN